MPFSKPYKNIFPILEYFFQKSIDKRKKEVYNKHTTEKKRFL